MSCCFEVITPFSGLWGEQECWRTTGSHDDERLSAGAKAGARSKLPPSTGLGTGSSRMRARDIRVASQAGLACLLPHLAPANTHDALAPVSPRAGGSQAGFLSPQAGEGAQNKAR